MSSGAGHAAALLADIGATNARFALLRDDAVGAVLHLPVADHPTAYDAIDAALQALGATAAPRAAVLAFAGPVDDLGARMTNAGWATSIAELRRRFGFRRVRLLNDYAALALGLEDLAPDDTRIIGPAPSVPPATRRGPLAVLGPGSGLGVAALVPAEPHPLPLVGEGGHVTMAAADDTEAELLSLLRRDFGHVSAERLLSGPGLVNLHRALGELRGSAVAAGDPAAITRRALQGGDELSRETLEHFCRLLGSFAGNVALSFGARGGVFLGGGILPRFPDFLARSGFRARFEDKGRFRAYLAAVPTLLITRPDAAFVGLAAAARQFD